MTTKRQLDLYSNDRQSIVFLHGGGWAGAIARRDLAAATSTATSAVSLHITGFGAAVSRLSTDLENRLAHAGERCRARGGVGATQRGVARWRSTQGLSDGAFRGSQLALRLATDPHWLTEVGGDRHRHLRCRGRKRRRLRLEDRVTERFEGTTPTTCSASAAASRKWPASPKQWPGGVKRRCCH